LTQPYTGKAGIAKGGKKNCRFPTNLFQKVMAGANTWAAKDAKSSKLKLSFSDTFFSESFGPCPRYVN